MTCTYLIFVRESEGKKSLASARQSYGDYTEVNLQELGHEGVDWADLARDSKQLTAIVKIY